MAVLKNGAPISDAYVAVCEKCGNRSGESEIPNYFIDDNGIPYSQDVVELDGKFRKVMLCNSCFEISGRKDMDSQSEKSQIDDPNKKLREEILKELQEEIDVNI